MPPNSNISFWAMATSDGVYNNAEVHMQPLLLHFWPVEHWAIRHSDLRVRTRWFGGWSIGLICNDCYVDSLTASDIVRPVNCLYTSRKNCLCLLRQTWLERNSETENWVDSCPQPRQKTGPHLIKQLPSSRHISGQKTKKLTGTCGPLQTEHSSAEIFGPSHSIISESNAFE